MVHIPGHPQEAAGMSYEDILNMPMPGAAEQEPEVIGGFYGGPTAETGTIWPDWAQEAGVGRPTTLEGGNPAYHEGDEYGILRGLTTEDRVRLQQQLIAVGLISKAVYGEIDDNTVRGFSHVLAMANRTGEEWTTTLGRIATNPALQEDAKQFEARPQLQPDYAAMAQDVKQTFRQRLGRDPDDYELQQLTGELTGYYALANEAQTELDRIQFEQQATPGVQPGGTVQAVDPMARFQQLFDEKYKGEMAFNVDKEDAQISRAVVESGTNTLDQMIDRSR